MKSGRIFLILVLLIPLAGCSTNPVVQPSDGDPLSVLPGGESFYLLTRPAEHQELIFEILRDLLPLSQTDIYPALGRTSQTRISGTFSKPLRFSGFMEGRFPAYFVRRSLNKSPLWQKEEGRVYKGPANILADTLFKNTLLTASGKDRLNTLESILMTGVAEDPVLKPRDREWWLSGTPALMLYVPNLSLLPLPQGMPRVPEGSSMVLSLTALSEKKDIYSLSADFHFKEARKARIWNLGLRIFLAGRLGLSANQEERDAMSGLALKNENTDIHLNNWQMSTRGWGTFFSSFSETF